MSSREYVSANITELPCKGIVVAVCILLYQQHEPAVKLTSDANEKRSRHMRIYSACCHPGRMRVGCAWEQPQGDGHERANARSRTRFLTRSRVRIGLN